MLGHGSWKPGKTQRRAAQTGISFRDSGVPRGQEPCCQRAANPTGVQPDAIVTRSEATQFPPQRGFAKAVRHSEKRGRKTESRGQKPPQHLRFSLPDKSSAPSVPQAATSSTAAERRHRIAWDASPRSQSIAPKKAPAGATSTLPRPPESATMAESYPAVRFRTLRHVVADANRWAGVTEQGESDENIAARCYRCALRLLTFR